MQSIDSMVVKIQDRADRHSPVDLITPLDRFQYRFDGNAVRAIPLTPGGQPLLLHDLALRQLSSRVSVPIDYLRRCPRSLADLNLNYWAQEGTYKREALLRTVQGNQVRAILSESYQPFDDADVFPLIVEAIGDDEVDVQLLDLGDAHSHVRILFPRIEAEARPGDIIRGGIHISNSEVGLRSVSIESLVYRLVCTNGLVRPERSSRVAARHVGNPARLRDFITGAVNEAKAGTHQLIEAFKASVDHAIAEPMKLIERTVAEGNLNQEQFQRIMASFAAEGSDSTLYGVINAFTHAAQGEGTMEGRYQMERVGAHLLRHV